MNFLHTTEQLMLNKRKSVLQICTCFVVKKNGRVHRCNVLLDSASDRSYATSQVIRQVKPQQLSQVYIAFNSFSEGGCSKPQQRTIFNIIISNPAGDTKTLEVIEVKNICQPITIRNLPPEVQRPFKSVSINSPYLYDHVHERSIDILIGIDQYWHIVQEETTSIRSDSLVATPTWLGWILSGSYPILSKGDCSMENTVSSNNRINTVCLKLTEGKLENFWQLESVGVDSRETEKSLETDQTIRFFLENLEYSPYLLAYKVAIPWRDNKAKDRLGDNFVHALKRLQYLHNKLFSKEPELKDKYYNVFQNYFREGIAELVPPDEIKPSSKTDHPIYYLPHRPIVKIGSSTPIRPVFDASATTSTGISLNDAVSTGPSLYPEQVSILTRFRRWPVAITGDINKAFLQIHVKNADCDVHRFLLFLNEKLVHCRLKRVPFGNCSSPFLLNATLKYHLQTFPVSTARNELMENLFVDNLLSGADTVKEAETIFQDSCEMLKSGGFKLDKWSSNHPTLNDVFIEQKVCNLSQKYLGLEWNAESDTINFKLFLDIERVKVYSKRQILSLISSIYDPLGFISPYILFGKILFQQIWLLGPKLDWDDQLPMELKDQFEKWISSSIKLKQICCPRPYFSGKWSETSKNVEIIVFGDASNNAYGAIAYLRIYKEGSYYTSFVCAKSRVAPVKKLTLPRLELMAALIASRLATFVKDSLRLSQANIFAYTDSTITLSWIKGDAMKYKTFICNRIVEIQQNIPKECWFHCPGAENPADFASRGTLGAELMNKREFWLYGPQFLKTHHIYPQTNEPNECDNDKLELRESICLNVQTIEFWFKFEKYSCIKRIVHIIGYIHRFINNCKTKENKISDNKLSASELALAWEKLWILIQSKYFPTERERLLNGKSLNKDSKIYKLDPYADNQILKIRGRIQNANIPLSTKHPIILPASHTTNLLIKFYHLIHNHAGVDTILAKLREKFWIIKARRSVKSIVKYCIVCQRMNNRLCNQVAPPLPEFRVVQNRPFAIIGLDYAGPLYCRKSKFKWYILLITCGVVRAVHLELVASMNLTDFLDSFSKFCSRRQTPEIVVSDNAPTFVAANETLQRNLGPLAPKWHFNPPKAPWWGGWYERLVRSVKTGLKKSVGLRSLPRNQLEVVLLKVEAAINLRPLTRSHDELPLRPMDFISPYKEVAQMPTAEPTRLELENLNKSLNNATTELFERWTKAYITNLPHCVPKHFTRRELDVGDLVLLDEEENKIKKSRILWPLGRIVKVIHGRDNLVRSVEVKTKNGTYTRAVQRLLKLELSPHSEVDNNSLLISDRGSITGPGMLRKNL